MNMGWVFPLISPVTESLWGNDEPTWSRYFSLALKRLLAQQRVCFRSVTSFPKHLHDPYVEGCSAPGPGPWPAQGCAPPFPAQDFPCEMPARASRHLCSTVSRRNVCSGTVSTWLLPAAACCGVWHHSPAFSCADVVYLKNAFRYSLNLA